MLDFIDEAIGLEKTLIVLTADHGMARMPEAMEAFGFDAGRIDSDQITAAGNEVGKRRFRVDNLVKLFYRPYLYLDLDVLETEGLDRATVAEAVADELATLNGIALAVPFTDQERLSSSGPMGRVQRNYHPQRSGDIYVAQKPYWFLFEKGAIAVMHGSPWTYDTYVPILFAGPAIRPQRVLRPVHPVDVAPTLAAILGTKPPAGARGVPLVEVVE